MSVISVKSEQLSAVEKAKKYIAEHEYEKKFDLHTATSALSHREQQRLYIDALHSENAGTIFVLRKKKWKSEDYQYYIDRNGKKKKKNGMQSVAVDLNSDDEKKIYENIWGDTNDSYISANTFDGECNARGMALRTEMHCAAINELHLDIDVLHGDFSEYPLELAREVISVLITELLKILPEPTMIVFSGRGLTWIYRYNQVIEDPTVEEIVKGRKVITHLNEDVLRHDAAYRNLVEKLHDMYDPEVIDIDTKITDHSRVCRVAGTINNKAKCYAELISCNPELRYEPETLYKLLGVSAEPVRPETIVKTENTRKKPVRRKSGQAVSGGKKEFAKALPGNAIPFVPIAYRNSAKVRIQLMEEIPERVSLVDGSGRHLFVFLYYCHCRLLYTQTVAAEMARTLNDRFAESLTDDELNNQIERVDRHVEVEWNIHSDGCYIFRTETMLEFLPISESLAREMGFLKSYDKQQICRENQADALARDRKIAELWLGGCTAQEISDALADVHKCTSLRTVKNVIKRLGLDRSRSQAFEKIDFAGNQRYARKNAVNEILGSAEILSFAENVTESANFPDKVQDVVCEEQEQALQELLKGHDRFIAGGAGTGKSTLIRRFVEQLKDKKVLMLAPTGVAASRIGGETIHHGLNIPVLDDYSVITDWHEGDFKRLVNVDVVIIDEIGMVSADEFTYIYSLIDAARKYWGRKIQIVCVGDFKQLAPVSNNESDDIYAFSAKAGAQIFENPIVLKHIWRQEDRAFSGALTQIANGDGRGIKYINGNARIGIRRSDLIDELEDGTVFLGSYRRRVNEINRMMVTLHQNDESFRVWQADGMDANDEFMYPVSREVVTYIGMPVLVLQNSKKYKNGMRGVIQRIHKNFIVVNVDGEEIRVYKRAVRSADGLHACHQLPISPAYAMTVHKAQGLTVHRAVVAPDSFAAGQLYTALSRVMRIDDLILTRPIRRSDLITDTSVLNYIKAVG